jgi:hypothetical protein
MKVYLSLRYGSTLKGLFGVEKISHRDSGGRKKSVESDEAPSEKSNFTRFFQFRCEKRPESGDKLKTFLIKVIRWRGRKAGMLKMG